MQSAVLQAAQPVLLARTKVLAKGGALLILTNGGYLTATGPVTDAQLKLGS